jgi:hypothetical protein
MACLSIRAPVAGLIRAPARIPLVHRAITSEQMIGSRHSFAEIACKYAVSDSKGRWHRSFGESPAVRRTTEQFNCDPLLLDMTPDSPK